MCSVRAKKGHKIDIVVTRYTSKTADVCIPLRCMNAPINKINQQNQRKCVNFKLKVALRNTIRKEMFWIFQIYPEFYEIILQIIHFYSLIDGNQSSNCSSIGTTLKVSYLFKSHT